jgi:hypothetical protein
MHLDHTHQLLEHRLRIAAIEQRTAHRPRRRRRHLTARSTLREARIAITRRRA